MAGIHPFQFIIFALDINDRNSELIILASDLFGGARLVGQKGIVLLIVDKAFANDAFVFDEIVNIIVLLKLLLFLLHDIIDRKLNLK